MAVTLERVQANVAQIFCAAIACLFTACGPQSTAPESQASQDSQSAAVETWLEKREDRREAALVRPREVAPPTARPVPVLVTNVPIAKVAPAPAGAAPPVARVQRSERFSQRIQSIVGPQPPRNAGRKYAAESGDVVAQVEVGDAAWLDGDFASAFSWFLKAAEQGSSDAQLNLGMMYTVGEGVPQDFSEGLKWFETALAQGTLQLQQLNELKKLLMVIQANVEAEHEQASIAPPPVQIASQPQVPVGGYVIRTIEGSDPVTSPKPVGAVDASDSKVSRNRVSVLMVQVESAMEMSRQGRNSRSLGQRDSR